jgi:hypothetical protein
MDDLPFVDEHSISVDAPADVAWEALLRTVEGSFSSTPTVLGARLLGCEDVREAGPRPLSAGSAIPGFHVGAADPGRELGLLGRHRFSRYALVFRLDAGPESTRLRAETRAEFPGLRGRAYRAMVIGSGMHVVVTRRLLEAVRRQAERGAP